MFPLHPSQPDYPNIAKHCNIWRNAGDISDSWDSVTGILNFYGNDKTKFTEVAGPGNFNDPDMVGACKYQGITFLEEFGSIVLFKCVIYLVGLTFDDKINKYTYIAPNLVKYIHGALYIHNNTK